MRVLGAVALASVLASVLSLTGCASGSTAAPSPTNTLSVGTTVFALGQRSDVSAVAGTTLDGKQLRLTDYTGKVVVLNVWGSWCSPCRQESPELGRLARSKAFKDVQFVGLDVKDDQSSASSFATFAGMSYPHLFDPQARTLAELKVVPPAAIPSTLIIDRSGQVAVRIIGAINAEQLTASVLRELKA
ncbi:MAG: TlpA disulfide reductase family protein [Actinobacteria bacterium]|nr:TlpA disulfide reductase family protein [Actinomycetota bacterium]